MKLQMFFMIFFTQTAVDPITFKSILDDQEEESWPKTYYKNAKKYMKNKLKSSNKDKGKKKKPKLYKDIMTQIESQTRYLFLSKEVGKYITINTQQNYPFYTMIRVLTTFKLFNVLKVQVCLLILSKIPTCTS